MIKSFTIVLLLIIIALSTFGQEQNLDSMLNEFKLLYRRAGSTDQENKNAFFRSVVLSGSLPLELRFYALEKIEAVAKDSADQVYLAHIYNLLGKEFNGRGQTKKALEFHQNAWTLFQKHKTPIYFSLINIGHVYILQKDTATALNYYRESLTKYQSVNNSDGIAWAYVHMGRCFGAKTDSGKFLIDTAIQIWKAIHPHIERGSIAFSYSLLADGKIRSGLYKDAIALVQEIEHWEKLDSLSNYRSRKVLIKAYLGLNIIDSAEHYLKEIIGKDAYSGGNASIYELENKIFELKEDYKRAYKSLKKHIEIKSKVHNAENQKTVQLYQYEKEKGERDVLNNKLLASEKEKQKLLVFGSIILLLVLIGIVSRLRYIKKYSKTLQKEKERSEELLLNILPHEIAEELKLKGYAEARDFEQASILFTDFVSFTEVSIEMKANELVEELNACFKAFDRIIEKNGIEKIKTIGDAYMAAGGLPVPSEDSVKNSVLAALEMQTFITNRKAEMDTAGKPAFEMRVGIHTGPVVAGIVGVKKFQYDIWGDTVNTASRIESNGGVGKVNISQATYELLKDEPQFAFESRGKIEAKGKGEIEMWFVSLS